MITPTMKRRLLAISFSAILVAAPALPGGTAQTAPPPSVARDLAGSWEGVALPSSLAEEQARALRELNEDRLLVRQSDGHVWLLAGVRLEGESCQDLQKPRPDGDSLLDLYRCFAAANGSLLSQTSDPVDPRSLRLVESVSSPTLAEQNLEISQLYHGVPIRQARVSVTIANGHIVTVAGHHYSTAGFPSRDPVGFASRNALTEHDGELGRFFDAEVGDFVVDFQAGQEVVTVSETSGQVLSSRPLARDLFFEQSEDLRVFKGYTYSYVPDSLYQYKFVQHPVYANCSGSTCKSGDLCRHYLRRSPNLPGQIDWTTYQSSSGTAAPVFADALCGYDPWASVSYPDEEFILGNAYDQYMTFLDPLIHHPFSYFVDFNIANPAFTLRIADLGPSLAGQYWPYGPSDKEIWLNFGPSTITAAANMWVFAHEVGHMVHDNLSGLNGRAATTEGIADHMPLRYALYRHHVKGDWPTLSYDTPLDDDFASSGRWKHDYLLRDGEQHVDSADGYAYYPDPQFCSNEDSTGTAARICASLVSKIYWELAWDRCELGYNTCDIYEDIIQSGAWSSIAWRLVNASFAYAIDAMPSSGSTKDFFDLVIARYWVFKTTYNFFDWADYARIGDVLSHHCVGWSDHCYGQSGYHYFPGSALPSKYTHKHPLLAEAENGTLLGGAVTQTGTAAASMDRWVRLAPGQSVRTSVQIIGAGNYAPRFLARTPKGFFSLATIQVDGSLAGTFATNSTSNAWIWKKGLTSPLTPGFHTIEVRNIGSSTFDVDLTLFDWVAP
jgi:hypothetical protein